jgi:hypothetical protein
VIATKDRSPLADSTCTRKPPAAIVEDDGEGDHVLVAGGLASENDERRERSKLCIARQAAVATRFVVRPTDRQRTEWRDRVIVTAPDPRILTDERG